VRVFSVIPGGPRSGPGRGTRLCDASGETAKVWVPFPALRAAGDDIEALTLPSPPRDGFQPDLSGSVAPLSVVPIDALVALVALLRFER
jgi:hypothetical protein